MKPTIRVYLPFLVIGLSLGIATASFGQQRTRQVLLKENPYRGEPRLKADRQGDPSCDESHAA